MKLSRALLCLLILLSALFSSMPLYAVEPGEALDDPALEDRARDLSSELRCLVCQNQSIDDSDAELAKDLRLLVRKRLLNGDSDKQVIDYIVSRYGDFVLLKPSFSAKNLILWLTPFLVLIISALIAFFYWRKTTQQNVIAPLSKSEEDKIKQLLNGD